MLGVGGSNLPRIEATADAALELPTICQKMSNATSNTL